MSDHPFDEVVDSAIEQMSRGATIFQKWSCAACRTRQTMEVPNKMFTSGRCEECGYVTDIRRAGCNFLVVLPLGRVGPASNP